MSRVMLWSTLAGCGLLAVLPFTSERIMPGVRRHPELAGALLVDRNIARWLAVDVFHLLGYRLVRKRDEELVVSQHAWDMTAPDEIRVLSSSDLADQPIAERAQA